jgi:hypothetical protein
MLFDEGRQNELENVHICGKAMGCKNDVDLLGKMLHVEHFCGTAIPSI